MKVFLYLALFLFGWQFGWVLAAVRIRKAVFGNIKIPIPVTPALVGALFVLAWTVS